MRGKKILLIIVGLTLLLAVLLLMLRRHTEQVDYCKDRKRAGRSVPGPSTKARVIGQTHMGATRALFGDGDRDLRFDEMTPGAKVEQVGPTLLKLSAGGGWELVIVSDDQGRVLPGTHLIFSLALPGRTLKLNCGPADPASAISMLLRAQALTGRRRLSS